jgi:hypothetical protein
VTFSIDDVNGSVPHKYKSSFSISAAS